MYHHNLFCHFLSICPTHSTLTKTIKGIKNKYCRENHAKVAYCGKLYRLTVDILSRLLYIEESTKQQVKQSFLELFNTHLGVVFFHECFFSSSYQLCRLGEMVLCLDALAQVMI